MKNRTALRLCAILLVGLTGCGDDNDSSSTVTGPTPTPSASASPTPTVDQKVSALEADGSLPKLDRSDSLTGPDTNNNGVRDDIEAFLKGLNVTELQLNAMLQYAKSLQATLTVNVDNKAALAAVMDATDKATDCLYRRFPIGSRGEPATIGLTIESLTTNTRRRLRAYLSYNSATDGSTYTSSKENTCAN